MLTNPTLEHLKDMKLSGMVDAYTRQLELPDAAGLTFEERFSLIVDYEWTKRKNNQLNRLIRRANFPQEALLEDIIYTEKRKLNKNLIQTLSTTDWIKQGLNLILTGPTGVGKTYLATAFGYMACRRNQQVKYYRVNKLLEELSTVKANGGYLKFLKQLQKSDLLILDDWGLNSFSTSESRTPDLTELVFYFLRRLNIGVPKAKIKYIFHSVNFCQPFSFLKHGSNNRTAFYPFLHMIRYHDVQPFFKLLFIQPMTRYVNNIILNLPFPQNMSLFHTLKYLTCANH